MKLTSKEVGSWDKTGRYYIDEAYRTDSSNNIRTPSRKWPHSEYKHIFTTKYAKQLATKLSTESVTIVA